MIQSGLLCSTAAVSLTRSKVWNGYGQCRKVELPILGSGSRERRVLPDERRIGGQMRDEYWIDQNRVNVFPARCSSIDEKTYEVR